MPANPDYTTGVRNAILYAGARVETTEEQLPSFSIAIETANLATTDQQRLLTALDSLSAQVPSPATANEVLLLDSGEASAEILQRIRDRYPWISIRSVPHGSDYGDQKALSTAMASGEVLVFADADCIYDAGWLASFLVAFAQRPDIEAMAGETTIDITGAFTLAMALVFVFPRFSNGTAPAPCRGFYGNNAAFRLAVFKKCPFPSGLPVFRVQNVMFSRALYAAGVSLWRQPRARAHHATPNGIKAAIERYYWMGADTVRLARLQPPPRDARFQGDYEPYGREGGRILKVAMRLKDIARQEPFKLLWLPLALPIAAACIGAFFVGAAVERFLPSSPHSIVRPSDLETAASARPE